MAEEKEKASSRALRVLVVDDDPVVCEILSQYLLIDGHTTDTASSGQEGLDKLQSVKFDLVIIDFAMPRMNGYELANQIKQISPELPIMLLSGFAEEIEGTGVRSPNIDCVASKPITLTIFRDKIFEVLSLSKQG